MSLNPRVCKKSYKVHIPMMGEACEFWLITVTDEQSITNPDKDHAYLTDSGKLYIYNGNTLIQVNCDICFTQEERDKLEGIEEGANKYVLPVATDNALGGIKTGFTQTEKQYAVEVTEEGQAYVTVPWTDTVYTLPVAETNTLGGIKTGYEKQGQNYPVLVDVDGNAYVNVPWTNTDTKYNIVSTTENGLAPMLPTENADNKFLNGEGEWVEVNGSINGNTVTGSTFSGETSDCGVQILEVQGKTVQQTTNGYQLFDASKLPTKSQGGATVTNNGDGSFTISGSGNLTDDFSNMQYSINSEDFKKLFKVGNVRLEGAIKKGIYFEVTYKKSDGNLYQRNNQTINLTNEIYNAITSVAIIFYGNSGNDIPNETIKPMLYQDGDGTWEPYTGGKPSPNPDYPMEIENVEVENIYSCNGNILDLDKEWLHTNTSYTKLNDRTIKITVVNKVTYPMIQYHLNNDELEFIKGKTIRLLYDKKESSKPTSVFQCYYVTSTGSIYVGDSDGKISVPKDITQFTIQIVVANTNNLDDIEVGDYAIFTAPRIIVGDTEDTSWRPYGFSAIETSLTIAEGDTYENGQVTRVRKQVTFDGSSDEGWFMSPSVSGRMVAPLSIASGAKRYGKNYCNMALSKDTDTQELNKCVIDNNYNFYINTDFDSVDDWKSHLSTHPLTLEYELATPTTEEFKVPTIPSYEPYTEISTNSVVDPTITFRPLPFTTCLVGEATEEESGYMPKLSGNTSQFLNGNGQWATPPNTTYGVATTSKNGLMSATDKSRLDQLWAKFDSMVFFTND